MRKRTPPSSHTTSPHTTNTTHNRTMTQSTQLKLLCDKLKLPHTKVIFLVGAGISTSAGIPDFRSPETGLYHNLQKLDLPYAEAVFDISFFRENPKPFAHLARELYPSQFSPTKFHLLMKLMEEKGKLHRVYTQNIDTLERVAGVSGDLVVEAHGSFAGNHCIDCKAEYDDKKYKEAVFKQEQPVCDKCGGLIKPDIVFFGESLPERWFDLFDEDYRVMGGADDHEFVTITAGTSLTVHPFASMPEEVPTHQLRVLVNKEKVGDFQYDPRDDDIVFLQPTDEFTEELCELMGWTEELNKLVEEAEEKVKKTKITGDEVTKHIVEDVKEVLEEEKEEKEEKKEKKEEDEKEDEDDTYELTEKLEELKVTEDKS